MGNAPGTSLQETLPGCPSLCFIKTSLAWGLSPPSLVGTPVLPTLSPDPGQEQHRGGDSRTQLLHDTFLPGSRLAAMALDTCPSWVLGRATLLGMEVQRQAAHRPTQTGKPGGCPDTPLPNSRFSLKKAFGQRRQVGSLPA